MRPDPPPFPPSGTVREDGFTFFAPRPAESAARHLIASGAPYECGYLALVVAHHEPGRHGGIWVQFEPLRLFGAAGREEVDLDLSGPAVVELVLRRYLAAEEGRGA